MAENTSSAQQNKKNELSLNPYKGTRDFYPSEQYLFNWLFNTMRQVVRGFGYEEYNGPMIESFELYAAKSGTELVNEQLYHFHDRAERHIAVRPEMTPTLARMVAAKANDLAFPLRWFSIPNVWRYEKPQRGRTREHWQINVDILGTDSLLAEVEILEIACRFMLEYGASEEKWGIHINNRRFVNSFLRENLEVAEENLSAVMRAIDRKAKVSKDAFHAMLEEAGFQQKHLPLLEEAFDWDVEELQKQFADKGEAAAELIELFSLLSERGIAKHCHFDFSVVRGLDYYTGTVFEMLDRHPENNRALFGGGRYDGLISLFQKKQISGVGFGLGDVTMSNFVESHGLLPADYRQSDVLIVFPDADGVQAGFEMAARLRQVGLSVETFIPPDTKLAKQMRYANRCNIPVVIFAGSEELNAGKVQVKDMKSGEQSTPQLDEAIEEISALLQK